MARPAQPPHSDRSRTKPAKLVRVAGLPAVSALFATAPHRVERLFFDQRTKSQVGDFCAELARARKSYRMVQAAELERVAGAVMHGGVVALARPRPVPILDPVKAADWARRREPLLLLDGIGNPHNLGAIARTAALLRIAAEQFLGKIIKLTDAHHAKVEEKPEVKKAGGELAYF